ncbi:hypothetical protein PAERUG_P23_East_of_England_6_IMP_13_07_10_00780 [Pseudomonas aeruginosa]|nr:hypothetical protein PAERUG_P28_London_17_02_11_00013 [Pseudomonas aeruginosa]CRN34538.1 hypothetical protein PAERUG_P23_East_of_England_6_IMP_13_07_10_00780 [Pseudomonas aeruginosa]CRO36514.1 hypothetical protein PAERUG_P38_London_12_VIM_2_08_12_04185 [Pseudomonas aeruginosa]CRO58435.1 hypothetical protein PAERUG_P1_London_28_IMP_1_04_05_01951 [Pseudomonas aeruginosa]CRP06258.1 hypothetical protein PAERUG_P21_London_17_VIM_2_06_10_04214 [Pseudomonas aeruginosa]
MRTWPLLVIEPFHAVFPLARIAQTSSIFLPRAKWMSKKYSNPTVCAFGLAPIGYLLACMFNQFERERVAGRDQHVGLNAVP